MNTVSPDYCDTATVDAMPENIRKQPFPIFRRRDAGCRLVSRAVVFLTADAADCIIGADLPVNGSYFMSF